MRAILIPVLCLCLALPAQGKPVSPSDRLHAAIYAQPSHLQRVAKSLEGAKGFEVERIVEALRRRFPSRKDIDYFWARSRTIPRYPRPAVRAAGDRLVLRFSKADGGATVELSRVSVVALRLRINDKPFNMLAHASLAEAERAVSSILSGGKAPRKGATQAAYDLLVPDAEAVVAWAALAFVVLAVAALVSIPSYRVQEAIGDSENRAIGIGEGYEATLELCLNRDENVPYLESEAYKRLRKTIWDGGVKEPLQAVPDCRKAAVEANLANKDLSVGLFEDICGKFNLMLACMTQYEKGIRREIPQATPAEPTVPFPNSPLRQDPASEPAR